MPEPGFDAPQQVTILGLGLMGASLALGLRGHVTRLAGMDIDPAVTALARERGIVDQAGTDPRQALAGADLIILAAPVRAILGHLDSLADWRLGTAVVIDLGSTKQAIVARMAGLAARFDPLGGHPMCGKERASLEFAEAGLFRGAPFAFCALERSSRRARGMAGWLAAALGAHPIWVTPAEHDAWVAATSHLPYLAACGLVAATPPEAAPLVGPGLRSASRLAASNPEMMLDILLTNREAVLSAIGRFTGEINRIGELLASGDETGLRDALNRMPAAQARLLGQAKG